MYISLGYSVNLFLFFFVGPGHTAVLHSAVLTLAQDRDLGPIRIALVDPGLGHAPMDALIPALHILDVMDAVMDAPVQEPAPVQGLMVIGALVHPGLLLPIEVEAGKEQMVQHHIGLGHGLALLGASEAAALVQESHLLESYHRMN